VLTIIPHTRKNVRLLLVDDEVLFCFEGVPSWVIQEFEQRFPLVEFDSSVKMCFSSSHPCRNESYRSKRSVSEVS